MKDYKKNRKLVFYSKNSNGSLSKTNVFELKVGDIIESTEQCHNDLEGYVLEIVEAGDNHNNIGVVLETKRPERRAIGSHWNLSCMKNRVHPGCNVWRGVTNWRGEFQ